MFLLRPQKRQHELEAEQQRRQKAEADQRADDNFRLWLSTKARLNRETKQRDKDRKVRVTQTLFIYLTISVRPASVAAQRTITFQYGRPLQRHS